MIPGHGFRISRQAEQDVREIEDYSSRQWGNEKGASYVDALFFAFGMLAERPELGRSRPDVPPPYLVYSVGSHLIVYRHNQKQDRVEILNVLHPAMNIEKRLLEALRQTKS